MSCNPFNPPSRPPSSASSCGNHGSTSNLPRIHSSTTSNGVSYVGGGSSSIGHDHTRPLPPPRLSDNASALTSVNLPHNITSQTSTGTTTLSSSSLTSLNVAPLTVPLAPLSTNGSFRSNNSRTSGIGSTSTISNNNNNNINNNNNSTTVINHVQPMVDGGVIVGQLTNSASSTVTSTISSTVPARSPLGEVTLTVPRPDVERAVNEYVETPFRQANTTASICQIGSVAASNQKCMKNERRHHHHHHHHQHNHHHHQQHHQQQAQQQQQQQQQSSQRQTGLAQTKNSVTSSGGILLSAQARNQENSSSGGGIVRRNQSHLLQSSLSSTTSQIVGGTITKQPVSFTKEPSSGVIGGSGSLNSARLNDPSLSIMCDFCGRCRCESCREPPPLPSRWLCDNSCFCSAETALDYASCLCCVKGLFYHCADSGSGTDSEAGGNCADEPCSCTGPRKTARWACLGALTFVLPCLLCYWPLKGCVAMCEACYARHASQGCRCDPTTAGNRHHTTGGSGGGTTSVVSRDSRDPEKRLLDPVTPEL